MVQVAKVGSGRLRGGEIGGQHASIVASGTPIRRPQGQWVGSDGPNFGPTRRLDLDLELGLLVGTGNPLGEPVPIGHAEEHLFGVTLFNDWSARDIQGWEYQPLGPFLAKNFGSTISPWVVTMEALAPFRAAFTRHAGDPQPLPYLDDAHNRAAGTLDIQLEVRLQSAAMRQAGMVPVTISRSGSTEAAYWTPAQLIAHHTVNGCNLQPGDLLCSGILSGVGRARAGSLLELSADGKEPITLPTGELRNFLEDGDALDLVRCCGCPGLRRIGFGPCSGTILPRAAA